MPDIYFLQGTKPLVKSYELDPQNKTKTIKTSYLKNYLFTSHKVECKTLADMHVAILEHAKKGHCMFKGQLTRDLVNEPRTDSHNKEGVTEWICIDLDGVPFNTAEEYIESEPCFKDVSYILHHSSSAGLEGTKGLRAHMYMMLSNPYTAPWLRFWLKHLNLSNTEIRKNFVLTATDNALKWPVDITTCQEDKILYIADPILGKGVKCSIKPADRLQYVSKALKTLPIERLECPKPDALAKNEREIINGLRKKQLLPINKHKIKIVDDFEVQPGMGELRLTEHWRDGAWDRFNINGGDSAAYYHPVGNFELIHNFKGEPSYYTKEIFPRYYKECVAKRKAESAAPSEDGDIFLAICDLATGSYHKVHWEGQKHTLHLYPARSEKQLSDFMENHGKYMEDVVPQWDIVFRPDSSTIIDYDTRELNVYVPSKFYRDERVPEAHHAQFPTIYNIMRHAVSSGEESEVFEYWMNWLACIVQYRIKTTTAWVLSGVSSTGKGLIIEIISTLLGKDYVASRGFDVMEDAFNSWMERTLVVVLEETQVEASARMKMITGKLKHLISEPTAPMRAMNTVSRAPINYTNFIFTSNYRNPVFIDPSDDRYNFGDYQTKPLHAVYPLYVRDYLRQHIDAEMGAFFQYLLHRPADVNKASTVIENQTRATVLNNSLNSMDEVSNALIAGDAEFFAGTLPDLDLQMRINGDRAGPIIAYDEIIRAELLGLVTQGKTELRERTYGDRKESIPVLVFESKFTRDELNIIYTINCKNTSSSATTFSRMLSHHDIHIKTIRKNNKLTRGIDITWEAEKEWCEEYRASLEAPAPQLRRVR